MTLIKSISGIRGTIGGKPNEGLTPLDIVKFASAYAAWIKNSYPKSEYFTVVVGRDARISGTMVSSMVTGTLIGSGINVVDLGISTTPTVEMAVLEFKALGGIIVTASHNPKQWNALKLLNHQGEFISEQAGKEILELVRLESFDYADVNTLGSYVVDKISLEYHIDKILALRYVDSAAIAAAGFKVVVDAINSSGAVAVPKLLRRLGVKDLAVINKNMTGNFAHNPEPLPEHLGELSKKVKSSKAHLGISVDPDVDRLALVCENGEMFGEEYTLVAVADYVLRCNKGGNTVSNLSSTRALRDVTQKFGGTYSASAVGEVHVVNKMKSTGAMVGGEGNGGVILPELHYGRDALVGIAIFLTHLAKSKMSMTTLRATYPPYYFSKNKIELTPEINVDGILNKLKKRYSKEKLNTEDGLKIDFENEWVHLRKSNTEPVIRIYSESVSKAAADQLAQRIILEIKKLI